MTRTEVYNQALRLPERERLLLAQDLWATVESADSVDLPLPSWQKELLDERLQEAEGDPGKPWEQVKAELWPDR